MRSRDAQLWLVAARCAIAPPEADLGAILQDQLREGSWCPQMIVLPFPPPTLSITPSQRHRCHRVLTTICAMHLQAFGFPVVQQLPGRGDAKGQQPVHRFCG